LHERIASLPEHGPTDLYRNLRPNKSCGFVRGLKEIYAAVGIPIIGGSKSNKRAAGKATLCVECRKPSIVHRSQIIPSMVE
jgi:hypothetical protein